MPGEIGRAPSPTQDLARRGWFSSYFYFQRLTPAPLSHPYIQVRIPEPFPSIPALPPLSLSLWKRHIVEIGSFARCFNTQNLAKVSVTVCMHIPGPGQRWALAATRFRKRVRVSECVMGSGKGGLTLHSNQVGASGMMASPRCGEVWPGTLDSNILLILIL